MKYRCTIDSDADAFLDRIVDEMVRLFSISRNEAVTRIEKQWESVQIGGAEEIIYHEDESYWAKTIYWGKDSFWWLDGEKRRAMGLAVLEPIKI